MEALLRTRRGTGVTEKKKLIEVALPLEAINVACKADKDRKTGTIRNLHKWFAPMPSPAWRALLAAALLDDPGDQRERQELFQLVEGLVGVDSRPPDERLVRIFRERLAADGIGEPVVFDPFCGGGSTLVEAQHLGLPAVGSDLNPIPVLITSVLTRYLPSVAGRVPLISTGRERLAPVPGSLEGFAEDVSHYARRVLDEAQARIGKHYPAGPNGDAVIAWWWARTIQSPDPRFQRAHTPLVNDWWLSKRKEAKAFVQPIVDRTEQRIDFEVVEGDGSPPAPSKSRCLFSGAPINFAYIREEGLADRLGICLMATITHGFHGRHHFAPSPQDIVIAEAAQPTDPPRLELPHKALGFRVQQYGIRRWSQLFTPRQMLALETFASLVAEVSGWARQDGADDEYAVAVATFLGLCVGKLAQSCSMQVRWRIDSRNGSAKAEPAFSQPTISPLWDFVETNPFGGSVGDWLQVVETALRSVEFVATEARPAVIEQRDARFASDLVAPRTALVATDPPYFSNFGYADASNYFYIWLRRALKGDHPNLFSTLGAPATGELISDPSRHHDDTEAAKEYFIEGLTDTLDGLVSCSRSDVPMLIVYAFKQQEAEHEGVVSTGWEAVLEALIGAGLAVVGTWPIHGTGSARARGLSSNALATYVLLVCRPRPSGAPIATFGEFRVALKARLADAVAALRAASIAPVDLAQSVVGPGMEVFSTYARVLQADGSNTTVREALGLINAALDEVLAEQEADFDPDTRWAVAWFEQYGMGNGLYGVADSLARAKNTALNGLEQAGVVSAKAGIVKLLGVDELPTDWDPATDQRLTVWEAAHQMARQLSDNGESGAAELLRRLGSFGEVARELAYRLHSISDRKKWSEEARRYNELVVAWPEIARLATSSPMSSPSAQETLL
jgi:putative DNA methylase